MTEQAKPTKGRITGDASGVAAPECRTGLDREHLVDEYEQSRDAWLQRKKPDKYPEMSEEEILDLAVEICRYPAND